MVDGFFNFLSFFHYLLQMACEDTSGKKRQLTLFFYWKATQGIRINIKDFLRTPHRRLLSILTRSLEKWQFYSHLENWGGVHEHAYPPLVIAKLKFWYDLRSCFLVSQETAIFSLQHSSLPKHQLKQLINNEIMIIGLHLKPLLKCTLSSNCCHLSYNTIIGSTFEKY